MNEATRIAASLQGSRVLPATVACVARRIKTSICLMRPHNALSEGNARCETSLRAQLHYCSWIFHSYCVSPSKITSFSPIRLFVRCTCLVCKPLPKNPSATLPATIAPRAMIATVNNLFFRCNGCIPAPKPFPIHFVVNHCCDSSQAPSPEAKTFLLGKIPDEPGAYHIIMSHASGVCLEDFFKLHLSLASP